MATKTREVLPSGLVLDEYQRVHSHMHERLRREVQELEVRIASLRKQPSVHSRIIIQTYERMIEQKKAFMVRWGMEPDHNL